MPNKTIRPKAPGYSKKSPSKAHNRHSSLKRGKAKAWQQSTGRSSLLSRLLDFFKL